MDDEVDAGSLIDSNSASREGPWMFALLALPLIERYGEEGRELIYESRYQDGFKLGQKLGEMATDRGDLREFERLLIDELNREYRFTVDYDDPARDWRERTASRCSYTNRLSGGCEMEIPGVWRDMGLDDESIKVLGELHCRSYNLGLRKGFNPAIEFELEKLLTDGDPYCVWTEEIPVSLRGAAG